MHNDYDDDEPRLPWTVDRKDDAPLNDNEATLFKRPSRKRLRPTPGNHASVASSQPSETMPLQLDAFDPPAVSPPKAVAADCSVVASDKAGFVLVDPFAIEPEPFNGRGLAVFDPDRNRELIDDMRARGNTVPVRLRPRPDGPGWTCPSGSRRVNAGRIIAAEQPGFRVGAIIDYTMTDADAYALCLADNHGRSDVTPLQRGREIKWAIDHLHGGSRKAYVEQHGADPSVVSRALDLVSLPEQILACAENRETLPTLFAEKLAPRLKDKEDRKIILARAKGLNGDRLPPSTLLRYLLTGQRETPVPDRRVMQFGSGRAKVRATVIIAPDRSMTFKLPCVAMLTDEQKRELEAFVKEQLGGLF
jgi:ParB/RepB/Spo0J family partition protein